MVSDNILSIIGWVWSRSCRTGSNRARIATSARKFPPWQSPLPTCSRFPRNARLIMASAMILFIIRSKYFLQKVASVAIACSWMQPMLWPAFHRPNAMLASRCDWVFSCDLIFTPKFFGLPCTPLAHSFCIADGTRGQWITEQLTSLTMASSSLVRSRAIGSVFPRKCVRCHSHCW